MIKRKIVVLICSILALFCSCKNNKNGTSEIVSLKAYNEKFVGIGAKNFGLKLVANKDSVGEWDRFVIIHKNGNSINLKMLDHLYVCADYSVPGEFLVADKLEASDWELFTVEKLWDNVIALKASNGKYVSVDPANGLLSPNKNQIGDSEKFIVEKIKK